MSIDTLGIFVGEKGNWTFFDHIYADLQLHYKTNVFKEKQFNLPLLHGRLNRWAYVNQIRSVVASSDACFFEWASELLMEASDMKKNGPVITRLHSYELYYWAPHITWDYVDKIILVSKAIQDKFNALYPAQAHKTTVIYNAKPLDKFKPSPRTFNASLGMLGSIHPRKRVYEIILMLHDLKQEGLDAHLHLAGGRITGPDMDEYYVAVQGIVKKLNLTDNVTFYDHVDDTAAWLQGIDIYISNSYWEGYQVSLVEAMATGCQCYSHFWDGVDECLPAENIYRNENELRHKILDYADRTDDFRQEQREQMRQIACEKFDDQAQKEAIHNLIAEVSS